jgi:hypothetical protein
VCRLCKVRICFNLSPRGEVLFRNPFIPRTLKVSDGPQPTAQIYKQTAVICFHYTCNYRYIQRQLTLPFPLHYRKAKNELLSLILALTWSALFCSLVPNVHCHSHIPIIAKVILSQPNSTSTGVGA